MTRLALENAQSALHVGTLNRHPSAVTDGPNVETAFASRRFLLELSPDTKLHGSNSVAEILEIIIHGTDRPGRCASSDYLDLA